MNTSSNLFNSTAGDQDFNATFTPGQVIRTILTVLTSNCSDSVGRVMSLVVVVSALAVVVFGISLFFFRGEVLKKVQPKHMITIFVALMIGVVFTISIADSVVSFCPVPL